MPPKAKPQTSRDKVRTHRARLRAQGMRPVTLWVPDMRSPKLSAEARRQSLLANRTAFAAEDEAWAGSMIEGSVD
ncbi:MAG: antitoxin MazE family protein [Pseudolabrys sp.]|nr:antitoxin MazE family protein [Pseudolabrys sp.]